eukprot:TRINITY_DN1429_c0_g1_i1.p1 TRINITY_DN1429_c0_g1~~TRINITY_DN1429_c0_g1_i1.p1  ORF type:complete len:260 (-),score=43.05 TRINITY_DN1429_c0_g1_i1:53-754(-)
MQLSLCLCFCLSFAFVRGIRVDDETPEVESEALSKSHKVVSAWYATDAATDAATEIPLVGTLKTFVVAGWTLGQRGFLGKEYTDAAFFAERLTKIRLANETWYGSVYQTDRIAWVIVNGAVSDAVRASKETACKAAHFIINNLSGAAASIIGLVGKALESEIPGLGASKAVVKGYLSAQHLAEGARLAGEPAPETADAEVDAAMDKGSTGFCNGINYDTSDPAVEAMKNKMKA